MNNKDIQTKIDDFSRGVERLRIKAKSQVRAVAVQSSRLLHRAANRAGAVAREMGRDAERTPERDDPAAKPGQPPSDPQRAARDETKPPGE